jgi:hypothetical protein
MASTTRVGDTEADEEGADRAAAAAQKEEKEKQASAGSVTPPPIKSLIALFGARH